MMSSGSFGQIRILERTMAVRGAVIQSRSQSGIRVLANSNPSNFMRHCKYLSRKFQQNILAKKINEENDLAGVMIKQNKNSVHEYLFNLV
jgi:hypothetical protein